MSNSDSPPPIDLPKIDPDTPGVTKGPDGKFYIHARIRPNNYPQPGPGGNTVGVVVPKTSLWSKVSPWVHDGLGAAGYLPLPVVPSIASGIDASIYAAEGDAVNAAMSALSIVPGEKIIATAGKLVGKGIKAIRGGEDAARAAKAAEEAKKAEQAARDAAAKKAAAEKAAADKAAADKAAAEAKGDAKKAKGEGGGYVERKASRPRRPNEKRWKEKGGTVQHNPDGSITYTTKDGKSLTYNKDGFPDFSKDAVVEVKREGLNGDYRHDEAIANEAAGLKKTPADYVWHHVEDGKTMQLVPKDVHSSFPHTGGASALRSNP